MRSWRVIAVNQMPSLSRRNFAALIAATPVAANAIQAQQPPAGAPNPNTSLPPAPQPNRQGTLNGILPFKDPLQFTRKDAPAKVQPFPMGQVRLLRSEERRIGK